MGLWLSKHCVVSTATDNTVVLPVSCTLYQSLLFLSFFCYYFCFIYNNDVSNPFVLFLFFLVFPLLLLLLPPLCRPPSPFHCPSIPPSPLQDVHLSRFPQELWHRMQSKPCTSLRLWRYCTLSSNLSPFFLLVLLFFLQVPFTLQMRWQISAVCQSLLPTCLQSQSLLLVFRTFL